MKTIEHLNTKCKLMDWLEKKQYSIPPHLTCSNSRAFSAVTFPASFFSLYTQMVLCISVAMMNALGCACRGGAVGVQGSAVGCSSMEKGVEK